MKIFDDYRAMVRVSLAAWTASIIVTVARAVELIPIQYGSVALLTVGVGIASSVSLGRMRLTGAITQVFQIGLRSAITLSANVFTDTCIMILDKDGRIEKADHSDAIGWDPDEIVGRELRAILAPRSHGHRILEPGTTVTSPMLNQKGERFDARLSIADLTQTEVDHGRLVVTVAPVVNPEGTYSLT